LEELPKEEVSLTDLGSRTKHLLTVLNYFAGGEVKTRALGYQYVDLNPMYGWSKC
jgi:hypothetical protein